MKQAVIIYHDEKPVIVAEIKEFDDTVKYLKVVKEAEKNLETLKKEKADLEQRVDTLEKTCREYAGRFLLDEGKITLEEFKNGKY